MPYDTEQIAPIPADMQAADGSDITPDQMIRKNLMNFQDAKPRLDRLKGSWSQEVTDTKERRAQRELDLNIKALRESEVLKADETMIPIRVIDTNIKREQPVYVQYLKQSRRLGVFTCISDPDKPVDNLELAFTRALTFKKWENAIFKAVDGSQTHGWDALEVVYDITKPAHVGIEHIGHDKLFFPLGAEDDVQKCEIIIRMYDVSQWQLRQFVQSFAFDETQVKKVIEPLGDKKDDTVEIGKVLFKLEGVVYVAWYNERCDNWLKAPTKLFLGRKRMEMKLEHQPMIDSLGMPMMDPMTMQPMMQQVEVPQWIDEDEYNYPITILPYNKTEQKKIISHKGRVFLDRFKQEAQTAVASGFVNGITRACNIYGSPKSPIQTGAAPKQTELILEHGKLYSEPVDFWSTAYPDPIMLNALQYFDVQNSQETGQPTFAVNNRKDSRKTAAEVSAAQEQAALLNSVSLTLFSSCMREILSLAWSIVQSLALQDLIRFMPLFDEAGEYVSNDHATIGLDYDVRAAGDVDFIQRTEKINRMKIDWEVISATPLAIPFLAEYLRIAYPDSGERWATTLLQGDEDSKRGLIAKLGGIVQSLIQQNPQMMEGIDPTTKQELMQLQQEVAVATSGGMQQ
jgi:hypothetical protein